jgi:hypothetical protein
MKMLKQLKHIAPIFLLILLAMACDKKLDISPVQSIDEANALSTSQDVKVTLTGAYDGMSSTSVYGGAYQYTAELLGDDREIVFGGTFATLDEIWRKTVTAGNTQVTATWLSTYSAINRVNNVLSALNVVAAEDQASVEGQARFIRGALYFGLVNLFGKTWGDGDANVNLAVPLVTLPTRSITAEDSRTRATVAAVYKQIIEDLTKAETLLPETKAGDDASRATRIAASAFLARVYSMQGNYAAARDAANRVIASGARKLESSFTDVFATGGESNEYIFRIAVSDQDGSNDLNTFYAPATFQGRGDMRVQTKHLALYDSTDVRGKFFVKAGTNTYTRKFLDRFGDVPVVRLAEMYLTRAECNQRLGTAIGDTPANDVNASRKRAGLPALATATLAAILAERKIELAFEGLQIYDVKRNKISIGAKLFSDNALVLPIPQREIDTNKNLVQNPGY